MPTRTLPQCDVIATSRSRRVYKHGGCEPQEGRELRLRQLDLTLRARLVTTAIFDCGTVNSAKTSDCGPTPTWHWRGRGRHEALDGRRTVREYSPTNAPTSPGRRPPGNITNKYNGHAVPAHGGPHGWSPYPMCERNNGPLQSHHACIAALTRSLQG